MTIDQIIHGDAAAILSTLPTGSVDLAVTDPPYLCGYKDRNGRSLANDDAQGAESILSALPELYRVLRPGSICILFCGWIALPQFSKAWDEAGFKAYGQIIWEKPYTSKARYLQYRHESAYLLVKGQAPTPERPLPDVQRWTYSGNRNHPTEKSVDIITPLIKSFSKPGDIVLDPFLGSGTTAVAAALNARRYIGIELEERYCSLARKRLEGVKRFQARIPMGNKPAQSDGTV